jgi:hypothetical protein
MVSHKAKAFIHPAMVDTCEVARRYFSFDGNSLEDLADFFGIGKKLPHQGLDMWLGCMEDDPKAWREMRRYNSHDVVLLREVYKVLRPWIENHPNLAIIKNSGRIGCPGCTSVNVKRDGIRPTASGVKQRMACKDCGQPYAVPMSVANKAFGGKG